MSTFERNMTVKTERLLLRPWQEEDLEPFAKLNADPRVMELAVRKATILQDVSSTNL